MFGKYENINYYDSDSGSGLQLRTQSSPGERSGKFNRNGKFGQNGKFSQMASLARMVCLVRKVKCI